MNKIAIYDPDKGSLQKRISNVCLNLDSLQRNNQAYAYMHLKPVEHPVFGSSKFMQEPPSLESRIVQYYHSVLAATGKPPATMHMFDVKKTSNKSSDAKDRTLLIDMDPRCRALLVLKKYVPPPQQGGNGGFLARLSIVGRQDVNAALEQKVRKKDTYVDMNGKKHDYVVKFYPLLEDSVEREVRIIDPKKLRIQLRFRLSKGYADPLHE